MASEDSGPDQGEGQQGQGQEQAPESKPELSRAERMAARSERVRREYEAKFAWGMDMLVFDPKTGELDEYRTMETIPRHDATVGEEIIRHYPGDFFAVAATETTTVFRRWNGRVWEIDPGSSSIFGRVNEFWEQMRHALDQITTHIQLIAEKKKEEAIRIGGNGEKTYKEIMDSSKKTWQPWNAYWEKLGNAERRNAVIKMLKVNGKIVREDADFDTALGLMVCQNVVLDLSEVKKNAAAGRPFEVVALPHDPSRMVTQWMDVEYREGAVAHTWLGYLAGVLPNEAVRWHVQKVLGSALLGDPVSRLMLNFIGPPASGKSVLINVLEAVFGDYAYFAPAAIFQEDKYSGAESPSPAFNDMRKKKLVVSSEANAFKPYNTALVKGLTGRDKQRSRGMKVSGGTWVPRMLLIIATNDFIRFDINDEAFAKRVHPIEFPNRFRSPGPGETWEDIPVAERENTDLQREIIENETERSGILNWLLEGLRGFVEEGVAEPSEIAAHRVVMKTTLNSAHDWFQEWLTDKRIVQYPTGNTDLPKVYSLGVKEAHEAYEDWCRDEGVDDDDMLIQKSFKRALQQDGLHRPDTGFRRRGKEVVTADGWKVGNTDVFDRLAWSDWRQRYGVEDA